MRHHELSCSVRATLVAWRRAVIRPESQSLRVELAGVVQSAPQSPPKSPHIPAAVCGAWGAPHRGRVGRASGATPGDAPGRLGGSATEGGSHAVMSHLGARRSRENVRSVGSRGRHHCPMPQSPRRTSHSSASRNTAMSSKSAATALSTQPTRRMRNHKEIPNLSHNLTIRMGQFCVQIPGQPAVQPTYTRLL